MKKTTKKKSAPQESGRRTRDVRLDLAPRFLAANERLEKVPQRAAHALPFEEFGLPLLEEAYRVRASDIHVEPRSDGGRVRLRIDGVMSDVAVLSERGTRVLTNQFKVLAGLDPVTRFTPTDAHAAIDVGGERVDLRMALAPCAKGEILVLRFLDAKRLERSMESLGLNRDSLAEMERWVENVNGMFLAAGPTGSGKTTTVYALLHELKFSDRVILSLEDPVEYQVDGITQIQVDDIHHVGFSEGVKAMLRMDPDYLMMGEIRDSESARSAVNAAISGRVMLSTIHSRDAVGALAALRNWGLKDHEIAESLAVVVSQRLVRVLCSACRYATKPTAIEREWLRAIGQRAPRTVQRSKGCKSCHHLGYHGRTGLFEHWQLNEDDYAMILRGADEHSLRVRLAERGHVTILDDAMSKVTEGVTDIAELRRVAGIDVFQTLATAGKKV